MAFAALVISIQCAWRLNSLAIERAPLVSELYGVI